MVSVSSPWQQVGGWERREERVEWQSLGLAEEERELREKMQGSSLTKTTVTVNGIETELLIFIIRSPFIINQEKNQSETGWGSKQIYIQVDNINTRYWFSSRVTVNFVRKRTNVKIRSQKDLVWRRWFPYLLLPW